jgi:pheromone shutdown-related protein TraB
MKYRNLVIIGTSHIAKQSLKEVKEAFEENPEIVALELDPKRLHALLSEEKKRPGLTSIRRIGFKGYLFTLIGSFVQRRLGKYVGMTPGSEMKQAFFLAQKNRARIALIDQDIEITMKKFSKALGWKEKINFLVDVFRGIFFAKRELKKWGLDFDLRTVPEKKLVRKILRKVKERYPDTYKVLIEDRNNVMAKNLSDIMGQFPDKKVLAIVGAGHEEEIVELVKKHLS